MLAAPAPLLGSLGDAIDRLGALGAGHSLRSIADLGRGLPDAFQAFGFECRLAEGTSDVDFGVRMDVRRGGHRALVQVGRERRLPAHPSWKRLDALARLWCDVGPNKALECLFLEFDTSRASHGERGPSIFLRTNADRTSLDALGKAGVAWERLHAQTLSTPELVRLTRCFGALPDGAALLDLGLMMGRSHGGLRVHASLPVDTVDAYLSALGVQVPNKALNDIFEQFGVDRFGAELDGVELQFEVGAGEAPRIGIEYGFPRHLEGDRLDEWAAMLERLKSAGLCSSEKCQALLDWPGNSQEDAEYGLSHIKLVLTSGQRLAAKAYIFVESGRGGHT